MTGNVQTYAALVAEIDSVLASGQAAGSITAARVRQLIEDAAATYNNIQGTVFNVRDFGAKGDGLTDDTAAFNAAIAAAWGVPATGHGTATVVIPPNGADLSGTGPGYRITNTLSLVNPSTGSQASLVGMAMANIKFDYQGTNSFPLSAAGGALIYVSNGLNDLTNGQILVSGLRVYWATSTIPACGLYVAGQNKFLIRDCMFSSPSTHGCVFDGGWFSNGWIEACHAENVMVSRPAGYGFVWGLSATSPTNVFLTECGMRNCTVRIPGKSALAIIQNNTAGGNYKISNFKAEKCELDCSFGSSNNGVDIIQNSSTAGNIIENIIFSDCSIEDANNGNHSGYAVGISGSGTAKIGPIELRGVLIYGFLSGAINTALINQGLWRVETMADGNIPRISHLQVDTQLFLKNVPTSNPGSGTGQVWSNSGVLTLA